MDSPANIIESGRPRVAVVSKADRAGGGASAVAASLSRLLVEHAQFECHHWLGFAGRTWPAHYRRLHGGPTLRFVYQAVSWFSLKAGYPDFFTPELLLHLGRKAGDYDLYHFHDTARAVSPLTLRWISRRKPVVFTFHDCTAFTGGCLYPMDCTAFHSRCGNCPQLNVWPLKTRFDRTGWMQDYKRVTAQAGLLVPIAPSNWIADEAMKSGMFETRPRVIPYCVDSKQFRPLPQESLRDSLGLPQQRFIVLLNVHNLTDQRKGTADAIEALRSLSAQPLILALGRVDKSALRLFDGVDTRFLGFESDRARLAQYCSAADILLFPTKADNLPNAVLEAMASGTPTVGYAAGGVPDMVQHRVNGWLAPTGDVAGLVEGLEFARANADQLAIWSANCRARAETVYSERAFLEAHESLYDRLLDRSSGLLPHLARQV